MKKILVVLAVVAVLAFAGSAFADRGYGRGMWNAMWSGNGCGWGWNMMRHGGMMRGWERSSDAARPHDFRDGTTEAR